MQTDKTLIRPSSAAYVEPSDKEEILSKESDMAEAPPTAPLPPEYSYGYQAIPADFGTTHAAVVTTQPADTAHSGYHQPPPNRLVLAFLALCLCCCCWPALVFAIVGMIYSIQVDSQWTNKDYAGAQKSSLYATRWSTGAIVAGLVVIAIYIVLVVLNFVLHSKNSSNNNY